jgi:hypothetical protein
MPDPDRPDGNRCYHAARPAPGPGEAEGGAGTQGAAQWPRTHPAGDLNGHAAPSCSDTGWWFPDDSPAASGTGRRRAAYDPHVARAGAFLVIWLVLVIAFLLAGSVVAVIILVEGKIPAADGPFPAGGKGARPPASVTVAGEVVVNAGTATCAGARHRWHLELIMRDHAAAGITSLPGSLPEGAGHCRYP